MKTINILFTSIGRRVELLQLFHEAEEELNHECNSKFRLNLIGADENEAAPALCFCDKKRKICSISNKNYISLLLHICEEEKIHLLIPTIDTDLLILAKNKNKFEEIGTKVLVSSEEKIKICRDKNIVAEFFDSCGLNTPDTIGSTDYKGDFPCFIKPKDGSSSINAYKVENREELFFYTNKLSDFIIQPYIEGVEYTVDILCDFNGKPIYITPRIRMAVRGGEVLRTKIEQDEIIIQECMEIVKRFKPCGAITVQLIHQESSGKNYYLEINPRFGGGAPLSMKAGANSIKAMLRLLLGEKVAYHKHAAADGLIYSRFDQSVCVNDKGREVQNIKNILEIKNRKSEFKGIIFDLDDTLYSEKDYVRSGFRAISKCLDQIDYCEEKLWQFFEQKKNAIDELLITEGLYTEERKQKCLLVYRSHIPDIQLYQGVESMLKELRESGIKLGMITDGRVAGQKRKIKALHLEELMDEIIITDEIAGNANVQEFRKPNKIAFWIMKKRLCIPYDKLVYIADNLGKDFIAPVKLGMNTIWFQNKEGLYH